MGSLGVRYSKADSLIEITKRVDAAVFIFNADDKMWNDISALESTDKVRDNVLFEYGLFMGELGKNKVCFICKGNPKVASDLKGITYINGDIGEYKVKSKIRRTDHSGVRYSKPGIKVL